MARVSRFPCAALDVPVTVTIVAGDCWERWTRAFGDRSFNNVLRRGRAPGELEERFGPFRFRLGLTADAAGITMRVLGWRLGPIPLPRCLAIRSDAREAEDAEGRFRFDVPIDLPLGLGRIVRYAGCLSPKL